MDFHANPFSLLTILVAPAILTNASSIMALSTSNRFALAIDRAKAILSEIKVARTDLEAEGKVRMEHLRLAEKRVVLLMRALTLIYTSVGSFSAATLISLTGAVLFAADERLPQSIAQGLGILSGAAGACGLISGCGILLWEMRVAEFLVVEESRYQLQQFQLSQIAKIQEDNMP